MDDQQGLSMGFSVNQPPGTPAPLIAQPVGMPQGPMLVQVQLPQMQMGSGNTPPPMHSREMMERGQFICAHCHTTHVTSQLGRGGSSRRKGSNGNVGQSQQMGKDQNKNRKPRPARPRSAMIDGQKVLLCNACGIYWQRKGQKRPLKPVKRTSARKKPKITMAKEESPFYHHVAELFSVQDADLLWCDCSQQCTTKYLMPDPGDKDSLNREECIALVEIHKKAIQLKKIKSFPKDEKSPGGPDSGQQMMMMPNQMGIVLATPTNQGSQSNDDSLDKGFRGYGRGHASSKEYERYVFQYIDYCKAKKLCGKFRKKLLSFSNDWLYKRPTLRTTITTGTDDKVTTKVEVYKGKPRVMQEKKFEHTPEELKTATCCNKLCCQKIWTNQIAQWRREYVEGNNDQRWNVIQQMLLGEGYGSSKCVNVVRMITGCSRNLVASVSNYLQVNQSTGRPPSQSAKQEQVDRQQRDHGQQQIPQQLQHQPLETIKSNPMQLAQQAAQQMSMNQHMLYGQSPNYNSAVPPLPPVLSNLVTATITHPAQMQPMSQQQQQQMASLFYVQQQK